MAKLRNIRRGERNRKKRWKIKNDNKSFFRNPYITGKSNLDPKCNIKVTFAPNLAKKLSSLFYYLILLFQISVANPENFEEFKAREVLKIRKEKTGILPTSLVRYCNRGKNKSRQVCTLYQNSIS